MLKRFLHAALICVLLCFIYVEHGQLSYYLEDQLPVEKYIYLPKSDLVRPLLLGHENVGADLVWIRSLGYFADLMNFNQGKQSYLEALINFATDLDPRFEKIYIWAGAVTIYNSGLITEEKIRASNRILEKGWQYIQNDIEGWKHHPDYWMIPQMIGFNYAVELRDKERGAPFIESLANMPNVPEHFKTWSANLYSKTGESEKSVRLMETLFAIESLKTQLGTVSDQSSKRQIENKLRFYHAQIKDNQEDLDKKLNDLREKIELYKADWLDGLPFVDFDFYLLLRNSDENEKII
ncbi:MAG TPA: hypothetical protein PKC21_02235 [Oligoflexia bacterium]|nr:hypothetical protein [Oligoflexia bacterium]HMR24149.1 hypothetical protein [Oligoflexia bacterium]